MPLRAQARRKRPERTLEADAVTADSELPAEPTAGAARAASVEPDVLTSIAALLWLPSYTELFEAELEHNRTLCGWSCTALPPSSCVCMSMCELTMLNSLSSCAILVSSFARATTASFSCDRDSSSFCDSSDTFDSSVRSLVGSLNCWFAASGVRKVADGDGPDSEELDGEGPDDEGPDGEGPLASCNKESSLVCACSEACVHPLHAAAWYV